MKLAEKYKFELNEAYDELRDLRARCLTTSEIQVSLLSPSFLYSNSLVTHDAIAYIHMFLND